MFSERHGSGIMTHHAIFTFEQEMIVHFSAQQSTSFLLHVFKSGLKAASEDFILMLYTHASGKPLVCFGRFTEF